MICNYPKRVSVQILHFFSFGSADNVEEKRELYIELLENELTRGPFDKIVQCTKSILMKIARGNHKIPEQIQNAAVISLGKLTCRIQRVYFSL